jgi:hypothetical protein
MPLLAPLRMHLSVSATNPPGSVPIASRKLFVMARDRPPPVHILADMTRCRSSSAPTHADVSPAGRLELRPRRQSSNVEAADTAVDVARIVSLEVAVRESEEHG